MGLCNELANVDDEMIGSLAGISRVLPVRKSLVTESFAGTKRTFS
jgi:hypothetical protein